MPSVSIPKVMRGVQMKNFGGPAVLQYRTDLPVPVPRDSEVLIKNDFIGINYVDVFILAHWDDGICRWRNHRPRSRGHRSVSPGSVNDLQVGDRVVWLAMGGYAEYTAVPAAGGIGLWLCQLLKALGAKTIGTAGTAEKIQLAKENGVDFVINYREEKDLVKRVEEITEGHGVDVVYDGIGKDQTENNMNVIAKDGTIVTYGVASGIPPPISPARLATKNVRLVGPGESALMRSVGTPHEFGKWCAKLFDAIAKDEISVRIHGTYPLSEIVMVHQDLEGRKTTGKVLVKP
ncbi:hypothetical protein B0O99DRAFT_686104 [Bisporella sp. PMI_857]|nr:hypothetical protein B0O99DRAFT_686104 [Bisporella sp. PMI_857]